MTCLRLAGEAFIVRVMNLKELNPQASTPHSRSVVKAHPAFRVRCGGGCSELIGAAALAEWRLLLCA